MHSAETYHSDSETQEFHCKVKLKVGVNVQGQRLWIGIYKEQINTFRSSLAQW
jgi:hypothetical protein